MLCWLLLLVLRLRLHREVNLEESTMQKSLVILLAICLISVHAFVKRDAPAAPANEKDVNYLENLQKQFSDATKQFNDKLKETFDPEELKKGFSDAVNSVNKMLEDLKTKSADQKVQN